MRVDQNGHVGVFKVYPEVELIWFLKKIQFVMIVLEHIYKRNCILNSEQFTTTTLLETAKLKPSAAL